jgi:protein TonB
MKKQLFFIFLMLISITTFGQIEKDKLELEPQIAPEIPLVLTDSICYSPDELPTLAMFKHIENYEIRQDSSVREMLFLIYKNVKFPPICRQNYFEGTAGVSFIIEKDGSMSNAVIIRNPGCETGEEALRVVQLLPKFYPAMKDGKAVRFRYNIPVKFRLE